MLSTDQIRAAYRATGIAYEMTEQHLTQARNFLAAIFNELESAGYLDPDGTLHTEEWEASADCCEVFKLPEIEQ